VIADVGSCCRHIPYSDFKEKDGWTSGENTDGGEPVGLPAVPEGWGSEDPSGQDWVSEDVSGQDWVSEDVGGQDWVSES
jgi:hypothetical protein